MKNNNLLSLLKQTKLPEERIPQAEIYIVKGGRHLFFIEFQAEASQIVLDFLVRHPLRP